MKNNYCTENGKQVITLAMPIIIVTTATIMIIETVLTIMIVIMIITERYFFQKLKAFARDKVSQCFRIMLKLSVLFVETG